jgi:WD40 repeat protein
MTSIEFKHVTSYTSPLFSTQKSTRRAVRDGVVTASVVLFIQSATHNWNFLFLGLTDGKILYWETDKFGAEKRANKDNKPHVLDEHKGGVRCMIFVKSLCQGVMFTGAADRCIKMWDLSDPRTGIMCVHSLHGHGGTVLALEYESETLLSSSTDGFMCVWRDQSPTKLLRFPAYSIRQKISPESSRAAGSHRGPKETWFLSISMREGEAPSIFAGDTEGYVHIYKPEAAQEGDRDQLFLLAQKMKIHELGISKMMTVPMESFIFTLSFDQCFKTLDSLSGAVIFQESNQNNVVWNGLAWDPVCQDVIVADEKGYIAFYNLYMESCVVWRQLTKEPIIQIHYELSTRRLLVLCPHALRVFEIVRGVKFSELNEHTGPIVGMASRPTPQGGLLYTAAMDNTEGTTTDNTIRMWDADALECIKCLKEKKDEITAMIYLPRANVIVTGHEPGELKIWSLDSQQEACLRTVTGQIIHENTISALMWVASVPDDDPRQKGDSGLSGGDLQDSGFETLVAGSYDRQLSFWKVTLTNDGTAMAKFERAFLAHDEIDDEILAVAYSSMAHSVFTGGNHGIVRKWSFWGVRQLEGEYKGHTDAVVCFAVDANMLFSGSVDCTVRIWETSQGMQLKVVKVHDVTVQALLVVPDSGYIASCAFDGRMVLWDPQIAKKEGVNEIQTYEQPEEFRSLAYVELNHMILVGCESGKIIAFPEPIEDEQAGASEQRDFLRGIETPPSTKDGQGREVLEAFRKQQYDEMA